MTGVGDFLKNHREQKGIRLEEIASITKIHIHSLELIESESWGQLPPEPFIRGFLTAYAKYVGADPRETLLKFYEGKGVTPVEPEAIPPITPATQTAAGTNTPAVNPSRLIEQAEPFPVAKVMMGVGAVAFVLLAGTLITIGKKAATPPPVAENSVPTETTPANPAAVAPPVDTETKPNEPVAAAPVIPLVPPKTEAPAPPPVVAKNEPAAPAVEKPKVEEPKKTEPVTAAKTEKAPAEVAAVASGDFKHVLTIETQKKTWIKVIVDGAAPKQTVSKDNDKLTFSAKEKIKLVLGNPTGVKVAYNGAPVDGKLSGSAKYFRYPADAQFPQDKPKPRAVSSDGEKPADKPAPKTIGDWLDSPQPESRTQ